MAQTGKAAAQALAETDADLLQAMAAGDLRAFGELYSRYAGAVRAFLGKRTLDAAWAEDLSQEVFAKLWQKAGSYRPARGTVSQWIFGIARFGLFDALRRRQCLARALDAALFETASAGERGGDAALPGQMVFLERAVNGLPPEQKRAVELVYFEGLTLGDCARRTGAPLGTVKWQIFQAHKALRAMLEEKTADSGIRPGSAA